MFNCSNVSGLLFIVYINIYIYLIVFVLVFLQDSIDQYVNKCLFEEDNKMLYIFKSCLKCLYL